MAEQTQMLNQGYQRVKDPVAIKAETRRVRRKSRCHTTQKPGSTKNAVKRETQKYSTFDDIYKTYKTIADEIMKTLITLALIFFCVQSFEQDTISITQFGYKPGSRENAVPFVAKAIALCKTKAHAVLVFPKGRYDFWPQYCAEKLYYESNTDVIPLRTCPILIENANGLTLDCGGSDFIFHGRMQPFTIDGSNNILISNVNVDWDIPMTAQAQVLRVTDEYIDLQINAYESPYVVENDKLVFVGEGWKSPFWDAMEFEKESKFIVPRTGDEGCLGDGFSNYKATEIAKGLVRLTYAFKRKPAVGNYLVLRHSARDHAGTFIQNSSNVTIENMNLYQTAGLGILSQYSENLTFKNVNCVPNKAKNRILSGHDDGLHFSNCKGKIIVEACSFAGLMDDPINVHGTSVQITEKLSSNKVMCKFMHEQSIGFTWAQPSDEIGFIENESMNTVAKAQVTLFKLLSPTAFELTFSSNIPDSITVGDALENLTWTPDVRISNSHFGSNRARGILVSTPGEVLIENNTFESSGSAILIPGDANGWFESGAVKNVTIRNNTFNDQCLTSMYQFCEGIISIDPEIPKMQAGKPFHRNITIEQNTFHAFDYPVLYAKSTEGLIFSNNTIERSAKYAPYHNRKAMITLESCRKVQVLNNQFIGDVLGKNILLINTSAKELKSDKSLRVATE